MNILIVIVYLFIYTQTEMGVKRIGHQCEMELSVRWDLIEVKIVSVHALVCAYISNFHAIQERQISHAWN